MTTRRLLLFAPVTFVLLLALALPMGAGAQQAGPVEAVHDGVPQAEAEEPPIVLYMTSWCPYCRKAQRLLDEIDADYVAKDIEEDEEALQEFRRLGKGGSGIPLIDFDGKTLRGFNPDKIRKMADEVARSN